MENRVCVQCAQPNPRAGAETCSPRCYQAYKIRTVAKQCLVCGVDYFARGKTCSKAHALELKKRTNRELFGADWAIQTDEAKKKREKTSIERYGVPHHLQTEESLAKLRATSRKNYGTDYPNQNSDVKKRIEDTMLERYGVDNAFKSKEVKQKIQATNVAKLGVPFPSQSEVVKEKYRKTMLDKYGVDNSFKAKEVQKRIRQTLIETLGVSSPFQADSVKEKYRETSLSRYGVNHPMQTAAVQAKVAKSREEGVKTGRYFKAVSQLNRKVAAKLEERYGVTVAFEKAVGGKSYDLHMENTNILIELNPLITHNADVPYACVLKRCDETCDEHKTLPRDSHFKKASIAKAEGYRLIQIYEWDSIEDLFQLIDGKMLPAVKKLSARKLSLRRTSRKEANDFLNEMHIQGSVRGQKWIYGLYHEDLLVAIASFGEGRFGSKYSHEWLRYAVRRGYILHGAPNLLLKEFVKEVEPKNIVSYVDFDHTTASAVFLNTVGFKELALSGPSLMWFNPKLNKRIPNSSLVAQGADRLLGTEYGSRQTSGLSNEQIMAAEGFLRVFTSGNRVFLWSSE